MPVNQVPIRPPSRNAVYDVIDGQCDRIQEICERTRAVYSLSSILEIIGHIAKKNAACADGAELPTPTLRKIAALAVMALEQYGAPPCEYHVPESANITGVLNALDLGDKLAPTGR